MNLQIDEQLIYTSMLLAFSDKLDVYIKYANPSGTR